MNHQNGTQYISMAWEHLRYPDIIQGLVKPLFSGFIIASVGCFYGMRTTGGTEGVGRSTIQAVVVFFRADHLRRLPPHPGAAHLFPPL
jgi:phospholipid/cholesterol/gamma-HCH transport system permease protein